MLRDGLAPHRVGRFAGGLELLLVGDGEGKALYQRGRLAGVGHAGQCHLGVLGLCVGGPLGEGHGSQWDLEEAPSRAGLRAA